MQMKNMKRDINLGAGGERRGGSTAGRNHLAGSVAIPLGSAQWSWGGTLTYNATTQAWALSGETPTGAGPVGGTGPTDIYPTWSQILEPPNPPN